ncbi:GAF and ANTAR domain-containing protein [Paractinoplanes rishiriensis]|uniref:Transcriptional regulator n=1 Tax=Paractinoplanes rishiriensis TaxID=1050105 RepID=A0A919K482_9ACTN|nr:GAF and ANTAR domain-containing protein [Actinoplanes rishiriensis]GIE99254.1 transcriptional regulator [Actinoplanes rishiriensis]
MTAARSIEPQQAFAELGRIRLGETELAGVLARVAELAKISIDGVAEASVTLVGDHGAHTAAFTGELAQVLDEFQYDVERGPCLDAATAGSTFVIPDTDAEPRWADYAKRAAAAGVCSSMAVGLPVQEAVTGALNLYAVRKDAFDDDAIIAAQTFAGYAAVALANAHSYDSTATLARQMRDAMEHRAVIEQAKGIVMAQRRCTADEAFTLLSRTSQDSNRKLRDVAADLVRRASQR